MTEALASRIRELSPIINDIVKVSGAPGVSIGILHQGEVVHTEGFGFRDVAKELTPDENTIYYLASLSKTFTATMVAMLVERGRMEWDTPISSILPRFQHWDETVQKNSNIIDFLAHRSGLAPKNNIWNIEFGQTTMDRYDALPMINNLEKLFDLRQGFQYNNWGYAVADEIITALSGEISWGTALKTNIFEPLGMSRTITSSESNMDNRAEPYQALSNCTPYHLETRPQFEDGKLMQGAVGVQSCVRDLLIYYKALLSGLKDQTQRSTTSSPGNPLVQVPTLLQAHSKMFELPSGNENSYALGWARTELPATLGSIGLNPTYVPAMPLVGNGLKEPKLCFWHQGSNMCSLHFVALLPDTGTAVLVLSNGLANNDVSDWIGQLLLQTILNVPESVNYLELAKTSAKNSNARWPKIKSDLENERTQGTVPLPLPSYVGQFYNTIKTFYIEVRHENGQLQMCFQGNHQFWYAMEHYEHDIFTWVITRDDNVQLGRFPVTWGNFYKIKFQRTEDNVIDSLIWEHDGAWPDGEKFHRIAMVENENL
ncbi:beta-lactamase/transpeptidase-like protein [Xylaria cf. heliscus]|nr:beta-lactamase/transpeptidase-like protein [Xylaria cf. heliscus]